MAATSSSTSLEVEEFGHSGDTIGHNNENALRRKPVKRNAMFAAALLLGLAVDPAGAQSSYPERPILVIVPQAAGGANDTIARIVMQKLAQVLKQPIVVENKAGAGGNIGTVAAAKAKPDG